MDTDQATEAFLASLRAGSDCRRELSISCGVDALHLPKRGETGVTTRLSLANAGFVIWGITCVPETQAESHDRNTRARARARACGSMRV